MMAGEPYSIVINSALLGLMDESEKTSETEPMSLMILTYLPRTCFMSPLYAVRQRYVYHQLTYEGMLLQETFPIHYTEPYKTGKCESSHATKLPA